MATQEMETALQPGDLCTHDYWNALTAGSIVYPVEQLIRTAPETSNLSKLVEQTRESMRVERAAQKGHVWNGATMLWGSTTVTVATGEDTYPFNDHKSHQLIVRESYRRWQPEALPPSTDSQRPQSAPAVRAIDELPKKAGASEHRPTWSPSSGPILERAPAAKLHAFAKRILTPDLYQRYVEPQLADMWHEYYAAIRAGNESAAKAVVRRSLVEALKPLAFALLRAAIRLWSSSVMAGR